MHFCICVCAGGRGEVVGVLVCVCVPVGGRTFPSCMCSSCCGREKAALQVRVGDLEQQQKEALQARVGELEQQQKEALQSQVRGRAGEPGIERAGGHTCMQSRTLAPYTLSHARTHTHTHARTHVRTVLLF